MPPGPSITAYTMTFNEASQIGAVLAGLQWADERIVVDSFSTDGTVAIAQAHGARVLSEKFCGFGRLRNIALDAAAHDWIVSIDADERCTPEFAAEVRQTLAAPQHDAYFVPRHNTFLGHPLRFGGLYPDYRQPQVFNRRQFRYREDLVHEGFTCSGSLGYFHSAIWQHPFPTMAVILAKTDRYTALMARRNFEAGCRARWPALVLNPAAAFLKKYVVKGALLDGTPGFLYAALHSYYTFLKYARLWELQHQPAPRAEPAAPSPSPQSS